MIEANALLRAAKERTGLSDWGDDWYLEPMHWLVDAINTESELTEFGAGALPEMLIAHLVNQLEVHDWFKRHPEIGEEEITAPLFGIGLPRTGSTAFSHMMGLDPATRILRVWEQERHCPPPEKATELSDPRIAISQAGEEGFQQLVPEATSMLPRGVEKSQECAHVLMEAFSSGPCSSCSSMCPASTRGPSRPNTKATWCAPTSTTSACCKLLQWRCPPNRWYLKTPCHTYDIEPLLKVFPDANFVWTHREPQRAISSVCSLIYQFRRAFVNNPNPVYLGHEHRAYWLKALRRTMDGARAAGRRPLPGCLSPRADRRSGQADARGLCKVRLAVARRDGGAASPNGRRNTPRASTMRGPSSSASIPTRWRRSSGFIPSGSGCSR